jgi:hypothetical protein
MLLEDMADSLGDLGPFVDTVSESQCTERTAENTGHPNKQQEYEMGRWEDNLNYGRGGGE